MIKVIRSQLYQLVLDKVIFIILLGWALMDGMGIYRSLYEVKMSGKPVSGGMLFSTWLDSGLVFTLVIAGLIMTKDFFDKTLYYELLSEKSRTQVFMGRFVTAFAVSETCVLLSIWTFPLVYTAFNGWGENLSFGGALFRTLLVSLFVFRTCAETALLTMLFRRKGFVFFMMPLIIIIPDIIIAEVEFSANEVTALKPFLPWLMVFSEKLAGVVCSFSKVEIQSENGLVYLEAVPRDAGVFVICTLGLGLAMLTAACVRFGRKDME